MENSKKHSVEKSLIEVRSSLEGERWNDLTKLIKSPNHCLLVMTTAQSHAIPPYRAEQLVDAGVAVFVLNRNIVKASEMGSRLVSAHGLVARSSMS